MPRRSRFKQVKCPAPPPCDSGHVMYKMRKSRSHCCRKTAHKRIGPSRIRQSPWLKFLHKEGGHGFSRKQLQNMYHKYK